MSLTNPKKVVTEERLSAFYQELLPYLGGSAAAGFTPVGTIIPMIAESAPANYLICDGSAYNKADYPELATHLLSMTNNTMYVVSGDDTKFKVPDLRGEFLRGSGTNSHADQGNGASVGTHQDGTKHIDFRKGDDNKLNMAGASGLALESTNADKKTKASSTTGWTANASPVTWSGDGISWYTSRPTNTSVLYCIATKNIYLDPSLDYSTDEKVVGTWINGKPIYQKTFEIPVSASGWATANHGISNIDIVVKIDAILKRDNNQDLDYWSMGYRNAEISSIAGVNANSVQAYVPTTAYTKVYITIQYTKLT